MATSRGDSPSGTMLCSESHRIGTIGAPAVAGQAERAQVHGLELDRVLAACENSPANRSRPQLRPRRAMKSASAGTGAERRVVRLVCRGEVALHRRVARPEDDVQLGRLRLGQRFVGPAIGWRAAMQIDVRRDRGPQRSVGGVRQGDRAGAAVRG